MAFGKVSLITLFSRWLNRDLRIVCVLSGAFRARVITAVVSRKVLPDRAPPRTMMSVAALARSRRAAF